MTTILHRCIVSNTSLPCFLFRYYLRVVLHYNNANRVKSIRFNALLAKDVLEFSSETPHQWPRFIDTLSFLKFHFSFWYDDLLMTRQHHRAGHLQIISHNEGAPNITLRIRRIISIMCLPLWKKSIRSLLEHMVWMRINSVEAIIVIISVIHLRLQWH